MKAKRKRSGRLLGAALLISVLLHGALLRSHFGSSPEVYHVVELAPAVPAAPAPTPADKDGVQVLAPTDLDRKERRVVETEKARATTEVPDARFLADRSQKVERETRAARTGDFAAQGKAGAQEGNRHGDSDRKVLPQPESGIGEGAERFTMKDLGIGGPESWVGGLDSATDDKLEGVPVGERTVLNTRELRYHSFYARVKEQLRQTWKPEVERRAERLFLAGTYPANKELVTRVIVHLDPSGRVNKIERVRTCGVGTIDDAAEVAFREIGVIPNPPTPMIDRDGVVRLHWEFTVLAADASSIKLVQTERKDLAERERRNL